MASQLDKVFTADPKSVYELFLSKGYVGFYIPAYQREYSWDDKNINRLIEDICSGVCSFSEHSDAITFIGTVISILDTDHHTIKPYIHGELPSEVMSLIDGQQRITTLTLLASCLYQRLAILSKKFKKFPSHIDNWIRNEINPILQKLKQILELDRFSNDPIYRYYPKIIRAYLDQWSATKDYAFYMSPIASYLFGFNKHNHSFDDGVPTEVYAHTIDEKVADLDAPKHQRIINNLTTINKRIDLITKKEGDETYRFPLMDDVLSSPETQSRLLGRFIESSWVKEVKSMGEGSWSQYLETLRCLIFTRFYLDRVAVTSVVATNETYAFDMFEALNTTGEPLTAFETFKPKVIDLEDIRNYEESESRSFIDSIDRVLDRYKKAEEKQSATTRLLKPFRLAYEGESLSKHLSDQRRFLNKAFDSLESNLAKKEFVRRLYEMSLFLENCWPESKSKPPKQEFFSGFDAQDLILHLDMLRESNHHIVLGPIFRYFSKFINAGKTKQAFVEFDEAVKTIVAFFVLWRATRQGTDSIDSVYRDILRVGCQDQDKVICKPLCISKNPDINDLPSVDELRAGFKTYLLKKLKTSLDKSRFIEKARNIMAYKNSRGLSRFMLLIAGNDVVACDDPKGLVEKGIWGCSPNYNLIQWRELRTIEHIYPQSSGAGWPDSISNLSSEHVIGNLLLLPQYINSSLGNRSWEEKKLIFQMLCSVTSEERNDFVRKAQINNIELSFETESIALAAKYMAHVKAVSEVEEFDTSFIQSRSDNIYGLVWEHVSSWLNF